MAGNIQKRPDGKWHARYRDPVGRERAKHFTRKRDAKRWLAGVSTSVARGEWIDPALATVTVGDWAAQWLSHQVQLKPSTRERYAVALRCQVLPTWGSVALSDVTHAAVAGWVSDLAAGHLSAASIRYAQRVLALLLGHAVRDRRLLSNPASGVRLPRTVTRTPRFLTHRQVHELADAAGEYRPLILILAYTGLRWGEAAALRVGRVDFIGRRLLIEEAMVEVKGHVVFGSPKSHQQRSVPLPRFLIEPLRGLTADKRPDDLVFQARDGGVLRNSNFRKRVFDPAAASAGLHGVTPHVLRHTAASLAVASGASVKAVQRMLGHASAAMTLDVYAGLFADDLDAVGERLDAAVTSLMDIQAADQMRTGCGLPAHEGGSGRLPDTTKKSLTSADAWSRLRDSNPRPTHYECVALAS